MRRRARRSLREEATHAPHAPPRVHVHPVRTRALRQRRRTLLPWRFLSLRWRSLRGWAEAAGAGVLPVSHTRGGFRPGLRSGPARLVLRPPSPRRGCVYPRVPQRRHLTRRPTRPARRRRSPDLRSAPAVCARAAVRVASASPGVAGAGPSSGVSRPCTSAQAAPAAFTPRDASNPLALRPRTPSSCWGHLPRTPFFFT